jgi:hypothetical protein
MPAVQRTNLVLDKIRPEWESLVRTSDYKAIALPSKMTYIA